MNAMCFSRSGGGWRRMSTLCACVAMGLATAGCGRDSRPRDAAAGPSVNTLLATEADMDALTGAHWKGTLTYLDYTTGKLITIKSSLLVSRRPGEGAPAWDVRIGYTDEPQKDGGESVTLPRDGAEFFGAAVVERSAMSTGGTRIVTETRGEDDGKPALVRKVYTITPRRCVVKKLVRWDGTPGFFERNAYDWSR